MEFLPLLRAALKSDAIIELLEQDEVEVVYNFDRLHEGDPDTYSATFEDSGFEMAFDEHQRVTTIFIHVDTVDIDDEGIPTYESYAETRKAFEAAGINFAASKEGEGWIKGLFASHDVHYEFRDGALHMVTIMTKEVSP